MTQNDRSSAEAEAALALLALAFSLYFSTCIFSIFIEGFHAAYMLPDGRPHRLLNTTHHVVFKPLRGITCKKRKFRLFDAIDQGLARFLAENVMLNTPQIQPWIFGGHVSHDAIPLNFRVVFG